VIGEQFLRFGGTTLKNEAFSRTVPPVVPPSSIGLEYTISDGNPPKNPSVVKVEISMKEFLHEKEQIHR
jgi:hypothetical protein